MSRKAKGFGWKTKNSIFRTIVASKDFPYIGHRMVIMPKQKQDADYLELNYEAIENGLITDGGYSHWFYNFDTSTGYVVGQGEDGLILKIMDEPFKLTSRMKSRIDYVLPEYVASGFDGIGFWIDNGFLFVDPIMQVNTKEEAIELGKLFKEKAIFDLVKLESITI